MVLGGSGSGTEDVIQSSTMQILIMLMQVIALLLYPFSFFREAPQSAVFPPTLFILLIIAVVAINTGTLSLEGGRASLVFIQGINIVVRMMIFFPNLKTPAGNWAWALLFTQIVAIGLSWYTMVAIERRPLRELNIIQSLRS